MRDWSATQGTTSPTPPRQFVAESIHLILRLNFMAGITKKGEKRNQNGKSNPKYRGRVSILKSGPAKVSSGVGRSIGMHQALSLKPNEENAKRFPLLEVFSLAR